MTKRPEPLSPEEATRLIREAAVAGRVEIGNAAYHQHRQGVTAVLEPFDHDAATGFAVNWCADGVGFGQMTFALDRETGEWRVDTEEMGPDFCAKVFAALGARFKG